jgi:hypothetical protein
LADVSLCEQKKIIDGKCLRGVPVLYLLLSDGEYRRQTVTMEIA